MNPEALDDVNTPVTVKCLAKMAPPTRPYPVISFTQAAPK